MLCWLEPYSSEWGMSLAPALRASAVGGLRPPPFFSNLTAGGSAGVAKVLSLGVSKAARQNPAGCAAAPLALAPAGLEFFAVAGTDLAAPPARPLYSDENTKAPKFPGNRGKFNPVRRMLQLTKTTGPCGPLVPPLTIAGQQ